ncbi:MAG: diphthine--ammonia ligase, partial [Nanoarchaeota archaeon]|nr:diphthine--ammonia ligase [Nanoarchaeota archaeon]
LYLASKTNRIKCLINAISENQDSYMFHTVASNIVVLQSFALDLPLERFKTKGRKEEELEDLKAALENVKERYHLNGIVTGAIASEYQSSRIQKVARELNLEVINPLWHLDPYTYLKSLVSSGFKPMIVSVSADGLTQDLLGKIIDQELLEKLKNLSEKYRFNLAFEGGEAETCVVDGPIFRRKIVIDSSEVVKDGRKFFLNIKDAHLEEK